MSTPSLSHPTRDRLAAFVAGKLGDSDSAVIERHLPSCDTCQAVLETLPESSLASLLRDPPTPAAAASVYEAGVPADLVSHSRYRILQELGAGGMGAVYKAEHRLMERVVALKVISKSLVENPGSVERFRREVKTAARLDHPNIVRAHDAEQAGNTHFLVMEYVEGVSLAEQVQQHGPLPVQQACNYIRQAAMGLQHAHEKGMVHRDIKPHNLMLTPKGWIKVLDFGLARFASERDRVSKGALTQDGAVMGTPDYIAPEQALDSHRADIRADIYSLGCTLYFLLTGKPPYSGGTAMQKMLAHIEGKAKPLSEVCKVIPAELVAVVEKMMAKEPERRYQTPAEVAQALMPFIRTTTVPPGGSKPAAKRAAPALSPQPVRRRPRRRLMVAAAAVLFIGFLAAVVVFRVTTDKGTVLIKTSDPDVQVSVKQGGKEVTILDNKTKKTVVLDTGSYEVVLKDGKKGLKLKTARFTLERGKEVIVEVVWEPTIQGVVGELKRFNAGSEVHAVAFSPDGRSALCGGQGGDVQLWNVETGNRICRLGDPPNVMMVAFSPKGRQILSCGHSNVVRVWDVEKEKEQGRLEGHTKEVIAVAFSRDGHLILTGGGDGTLRLWEADTLKQVRVFQGRTEFINSVALSPDGRYAISAANETEVRLWDVKTGNEIRRLRGHSANVRRVAFSSDGRKVVSGSFDKTARIWDVETGRELRQLVGHAGIVECVTFSPDDRQVLSSSTDGTVRLWDSDLGKQLHQFDGHTGKVNYVAFAPNGTQMLSGSSDGTMRLWQVRQAASVEKNPMSPGADTGTKTITNSIGMKLALIPPGKFMMGSPKDEKSRNDDEEQHQVEITKPFYVGVYTVTQTEYERVMGRNPSAFSSLGEHKASVQGMDTSRFPVEGVTWDEAVEFCHKLSQLPEEKRAGREYRLPTEAEWEYACRAGTTTQFHFGSSLSSRQANFDGNQQYGGPEKGPYLKRTTTVGSYQPNQFGLYDMHGNLWQWCQDWYDEGYYRQSPKVNPPGPAKGSRRVQRGGCWGANPGSNCRSAKRMATEPGGRYDGIGFRVVCTIATPSSSGWTDLLPLIDLEKHRVHGVWKREGASLVATSDEFSRIAIPVMPLGDYELRVRLTRQREGAREINFMLPVGDAACMVSLGRGPNCWIGLQNLHGKDLGKDYPGSLGNEHAHLVHIKVTCTEKTAHLSIDLDGKPVGDWNGPESAFSLRNDWRLYSSRNLIGLGAHADTVIFHKAELRMISGRVKPLKEPRLVANIPRDEWVDVLGLVDPAKHRVSGDWKRQGKELIAKSEEFSRIIIPVVLDGSYELKVSLTRQEGKDEDNIILPIGKTSCILSVPGGDWLVLNSVGKRGVGRVLEPGELQNNRKYDVTIKVTVDGKQAVISASINGKPGIVWQGPIATVAPNHNWLLHPSSLGLGVHRDTVIFHSAELRVLSGTAHRMELP